MMLGSTMCEVEIFMITIQAPDSSRELNVDVTKVEKWELQKITTKALKPNTHT